MALPNLRSLLGEDGFVLSAWSSLTDPMVHEALLRSPFDALTLDTQHGLHHPASIEAGIARAALIGKPCIVRVPIECIADAARALDFGASGVIMPMVGGAEDAARLVAAVKYPPVGERSFGPSRAVQVHRYENGKAYVGEANSVTLAFAMVETKPAIEALDAILAVDGLDGVFVGPSDLSISLSGGSLDPAGPQADAMIRHIGEATAKAGKIPAIYAITAEDAKRYRSYGFRYICLASDIGILAAGAKALAEAARA